MRPVVKGIAGTFPFTCVWVLSPGGWRLLLRRPARPIPASPQSQTGSGRLRPGHRGAPATRPAVLARLFTVSKDAIRAITGEIRQLMNQYGQT